MVDVVSGSHHHLEGWDQFTARCTVPRHPKEPAEAGGGGGLRAVEGIKGKGAKRDKADLKSRHNFICLMAKDTKKQNKTKTIKDVGVQK